MLFQPTPRLKPETDYLLQLTRTALTAAGDSLELPLVIKFSTQPVRATNISPPNGYIFVNPFVPIAVGFNTLMNTASAENAFTVSPQTSGGFVWSGLSGLRFTPSKGLLTNTKYTVSLNTTAQDFEGFALKEPLEFSFTTDFLRVVNNSPNNQQTFVDTLASLYIRFNASVDREAVESAFSTTPAASGEFRWLTGYNFNFTPSPAWQPNTEYTVRIDTTATDLGGNGLPAPFSFSFTTRP